MTGTAQTAPVSARLLTPKEFSAAIGGLRSPRWFREQAAIFIRSKGQRGIRCERIGGDYFLHPSELEKFRPSLTELRFLVAL